MATTPANIIIPETQPQSQTHPQTQKIDILDGTQIVSKIMEFIKNNTSKAPLFPWLALNIAYCPFMHKNAYLTLPELENAKIIQMINIGSMENGIRYRFLHTLYNDLYIIKIKGFSIWELEMLERIKKPTWISDMYMLAESFRRDIVKSFEKNQFQSLQLLQRSPQHDDMFNGKYLYGRMKTFIENNKIKAPMFPWQALEMLYCHFLYKYGYKTIEELDDTKYECIVDICNLNNGVNYTFVVNMFEDLKLIRKTNFENFENVMMAKIQQTEWDVSWLYDLYIFAEIYYKANIKTTDT